MGKAGLVVVFLPVFWPHPPFSPSWGGGGEIEDGQVVFKRRENSFFAATQTPTPRPTTFSTHINNDKFGRVQPVRAKCLNIFQVCEPEKERVLLEHIPIGSGGSPL